MKIKIKQQDQRLMVRAKLPHGVKVDQQAIQFFQGNVVRGLFNPIQESVKSSSVEFTGPLAIPLSNWLAEPRRRDEYYKMIMQVVDLARRLALQSMPLGYVNFQPDQVFINLNTQELYFIFLPVCAEPPYVDLRGFVEEISSLYIPDSQQSDMARNEVVYSLANAQPTDLSAIEALIKSRDPELVRRVRRIGAARTSQSGFIQAQASRPHQQGPAQPLPQNMNGAPGMNGSSFGAQPVPGVMQGRTNPAPNMMGAGLQMAGPNMMGSGASAGADGYMQDDFKDAPTAVVPNGMMQNPMGGGGMGMQPNAPGPAGYGSQNGQGYGAQAFAPTGNGGQPQGYGADFANNGMAGMGMPNAGMSGSPMPGAGMAGMQGSPSLMGPAGGSKAASDDYDPTVVVVQAGAQAPVSPQPEMMQSSSEQFTPWCKLIRVSTQETVPVTRAVFRLGREKSSDYQIRGNTAVGRAHADLILRGRMAYVVDRNSMNKTYINNVRLNPQTESAIANGDRLRLADEEFIFALI